MTLRTCRLRVLEDREAPTGPRTVAGRFPFLLVDRGGEREPPKRGQGTAGNAATVQRVARPRRLDERVNGRELLRGLTPPALASVLRRLRGRLSPSRGRLGEAPEWQVVPEGWTYSARHPEVKGWNVPSVLETQMRKWPLFLAMVDGSGPLGLAHESDLSDRCDLISHNAVMSFAYVTGLACHMRERVSLLDWGGGLGHYLVLGRRLHPEVEIDYYCKDVPLLAEQGARLFPDQHFTADDACLNGTYDLVMASTSLHYEEDWRSLLARLGAASRDILYVTGLPVVARAASFVFVQRPYEFGYTTEYLAWCLNCDEFIAEAEMNGLRLRQQFVVGHRPPICGAAEQAEYRGFLFRTAGDGWEVR